MEAIAVAINRGLKLPIVYNTSAYDSIESLKLMEGIVEALQQDIGSIDYWRNHDKQKKTRSEIKA